MTGQRGTAAPAGGPAYDAAHAAADIRYRRLLDTSVSPVCLHDGHIVHYVNMAGARALGMTSDGQIIGRPIADFLDLASLDAVRAQLETLRADGDVTDPVEVTLRRIDGSTVALHAVATLRADRGAAMFEVVFQTPLAPPAAAPLRAAPAQPPGPSPVIDDCYRVLDLLHVGVVVMNSDGRFAFTNEAARRILGANADELLGQHHSSSGADLPMYDAEGAQIGTDSHPLRWILKTGLSVVREVVGVDRFDGQRVWLTGNGCLIDPQDPATSSVLLSFTDITEHYDARERLWHEATHDWLTGLPNRVHALNLAAAALVGTGDDRLAAVLFLDLNGMKAVNDCHGHPTGDDVLRIAAQRMRAAVRPQDLVARIGGDEFVVLMMGALSADELEAIVERLKAGLAEDISVGSKHLRIGVSVGVTRLSDDDGRSLAEVLRDADTAMYRAKTEGRSPATGSDR
ncbi:diguanylate cyclase [Mycolicibacterium duvalii]|uniref:diguanylate cyclase n=1 Tax=Mycolicibacterium duvalii TaxID=39688 RepID=UPI0013D874FA|nr:diguanylate cyclase [Mycolicibacterium duvalii]MCV7370516.1 diguanylate cyclase [Mycolicibacterium duvalii]